MLIVSCVVCPGQHNHPARLYQCCLCHVSCVQQGSISAACGVCRVSRPTQPSSKALSVLLVSCVVCPARLYQCYLWRVSCVNSNTTTLQRDCMTALRCRAAQPAGTGNHPDRGLLHACALRAAEWTADVPLPEALPWRLMHMREKRENERRTTERER